VSERFRSTDRATQFAASRYAPERYERPVLFIRSSQHAAGFGGALDLGWAEFTHGPVDVHVIPGDHNSIFQEPNIAVLAERILAGLALAGGNG